MWLLLVISSVKIKLLKKTCKHRKLLFGAHLLHKFKNPIGKFCQKNQSDADVHVSQQKYVKHFTILRMKGRVVIVAGTSTFKTG